MHKLGTQEWVDIDLVFLRAVFAKTMSLVHVDDKSMI